MVISHKGSGAEFAAVRILANPTGYSRLSLSRAKSINSADKRNVTSRFKICVFGSCDAYIATCLCIGFEIVFVWVRAVVFDA